MKVGAHPVLVAVALGLLGPGVLETNDDDQPEAVESERRAALTVRGTADAHTASPTVDETEWHRVEQLWLAARETI